MAEASADPNAGKYDKADTAILIYILYLASLPMPILPSLIGLIWAYVERGNVTDWVKSHYEFQINTFWKGLLALVIGVVTSVILVGYLIIAGYVLWLIIRCVKGINAARRREEIDDPKKWLF